jgi:hypothetical protein
MIVLHSGVSSKKRKGITVSVGTLAGGTCLRNILDEFTLFLHFREVLNKGSGLRLVA